jgi:hypothetical protein
VNSRHWKITTSYFLGLEKNSGTRLALCNRTACRPQWYNRTTHFAKSVWGNSYSNSTPSPPVLKAQQCNLWLWYSLIWQCKFDSMEPIGNCNIMRHINQYKDRSQYTGKEWYGVGSNTFDKMDNFIWELICKVDISHSVYVTAASTDLV